jgi:hypothetical protein
MRQQKGVMPAVNQQANKFSSELTVIRRDVPAIQRDLEATCKEFGTWRHIKSSEYRY